MWWMRSLDNLVVVVLNNFELSLCSLRGALDLDFACADSSFHFNLPSQSYPQHHFGEGYMTQNTLNRASTTFQPPNFAETRDAMVGSHWLSLATDCADATIIGNPFKGSFSAAAQDRTNDGYLLPSHVGTRLIFNNTSRCLVLSNEVNQ